MYSGVDGKARRTEYNELFLSLEKNGKFSAAPNSCILVLTCQFSTNVKCKLHRVKSECWYMFKIASDIFSVRHRIQILKSAQFLISCLELFTRVI